MLHRFCHPFASPSTIISCCSSSNDPINPYLTILFSADVDHHSLKEVISLTNSSIDVPLPLENVQSKVLMMVLRRRLSAISQKSYQQMKPMKRRWNKNKKRFRQSTWWPRLIAVRWRDDDDQDPSVQSSCTTLIPLGMESDDLNVSHRCHHFISHPIARHFLVLFGPSFTLPTIYLFFIGTKQ